MNKEPLSSAVDERNVVDNNNAAACAVAKRERQLMSTSISSHACVKIRNSMAMIQSLVDPFLSIASEQEICIVAMRLDQVASILQTRVGVNSTTSFVESPLGRPPPLSPLMALPHDTPNLSSRPRLQKAASMSSLNTTPSVAFSNQVSVSYIGSSGEYSQTPQPLLKGESSLEQQVDLNNNKLVPVPTNSIDKKDEDGDQVTEEADNRVNYIKEPTRYAGSLVDAGDENGDDKIDGKKFFKMVSSGALKRSKKNEKKKTPRAKALERSSRFASRMFLAPSDKNIETLTIGDDKWLLHPNSRVNLLWGGLISLLIFVVLITMPLSFGWNEFGDSLLIYNTIVDFVFMLDLVKNFFTGIVDEDDTIIMDAPMIRKKYVRGYLFFDATSSIPLDLIFHLTRYMETSTAENSIKLLKLLLIAKLLRFRRVKNAFDLVGTISARLEETLNIRISDGFAKITRLFVMAIILAHWIGCFQFMLVQALDFPEDSWAVYAGLDDEPPAVQWSWSLFKALAQMIMIGFETPPFTNGSCDSFTNWCQIEHWVTLVCLYIGAVFYSFLITYMLAIIQTTFFACRNFEEKYMELDGWMRAKKMPMELRHRVKNNFRKLHANGKLYDESVLRVIAPSDVVDIHRVQAEHLLNRIPFFVELPESEGLPKKLAFHMEKVVMSKNEIIFEEEAHGDLVCFIESGLVELHLPSCDHTSYRVIGERCFFGEVEPLFGTLTTAAARVKRDCVLYQIASEDLLAVLKEYPRATRALKRVAYERLTRVQAYRNPDPEDDDSAKDDDIDTQDARVAKSDKDDEKEADAEAGESGGDKKGAQKKNATP